MRRFITLCLLWSLSGHDVVVRLPVLLVVVDVWLAGNCTGDRKCRDWRDLHILPGRAPSTLTAPHAHQQLISSAPPSGQQSPHPRSLSLARDRTGGPTVATTARNSIKQPATRPPTPSPTLSGESPVLSTYYLHTTRIINNKIIKI